MFCFLGIWVWSHPLVWLCALKIIWEDFLHFLRITSVSSLNFIGSSFILIVSTHSNFSWFREFTCDLIWMISIFAYFSVSISQKAVSHQIIMIIVFFVTNSFRSITIWSMFSPTVRKQLRILYLFFFHICFWLYISLKPIQMFLKWSRVG